jgi:hypothetical protein
VFLVGCVCGTRAIGRGKLTSLECPQHGPLVPTLYIETEPDMVKVEVQRGPPSVAPTSVPNDPNVPSGMFRSFDY